MFFMTNSIKVSNAFNILFGWSSPSWVAKATMLGTISSCCYVTTQDLYENSLVASINFMIDTLSILPNLFLVIIGTPEVLVPSNKIKQFPWVMGIALEFLRKYWPKMIVWPSNEAIVKSKVPNHSPTYKGAK
jgi:hypothetical protein